MSRSYRGSASAKALAARSVARCSMGLRAENSMPC
jgi:hypothetical protein